MAITFDEPDIDEPERDVVVVECRAAADGVIVVTLADPRGGQLPGWEPGAHIDLDLPGGLTRQYSLCGSPFSDHWQVAVLLESGSHGAARYLHESVREGHVLRARGPRNHFGLASAENYLFIAGGIGITALLPMIAAAERDGAKWRLLYGGRTRASMAFLDVLAAYGDRVEVRPQDEYGLLDLRAAFESTTPATRVYCCGPEPLLAAVEEMGAHIVRRVHVERFARSPR